MGSIEVKKEKGRYRVSLFHSDNSKRKGKCHYWNIIDKDPNKLAQILMDFWLDGIPIEKAYQIMQTRLRKKDWLGF